MAVFARALVALDPLFNLEIMGENLAVDADADSVPFLQLLGHAAADGALDVVVVVVGALEILFETSHRTS